MDVKITELQNEATTIQEIASNIATLTNRLDNATASATLRSLNTAADAMRSELFNLQKLIDEFAE